MLELRVGVLTLLIVLQGVGATVITEKVITNTRILTKESMNVFIFSGYLKLKKNSE